MYAIRSYYGTTPERISCSMRSARATYPRAYTVPTISTSTAPGVWCPLTVRSGCLRDRITSYNVCYTKLLRRDSSLPWYVSPSRFACDYETIARMSDSRRMRYSSPSSVTSVPLYFPVITSYSIHYTKLYDGVGRALRRPPP